MRMTKIHGNNYTDSFSSQSPTNKLISNAFNLMCGLGNRPTVYAWRNGYRSHWRVRIRIRKSLMRSWQTATIT